MNRKARNGHKRREARQKQIAKKHRSDAELARQSAVVQEHKARLVAAGAVDVLAELSRNLKGSPEFEALGAAEQEKLLWRLALKLRSQAGKRARDSAQ